MNIEDIATELLKARAERSLVVPISARDPGFGLAAAYEVALEILRRRRARGEVPIGRKIGFTNRNIWPAFKVDTPIWAHVFDTTVRDVEGGAARLSFADFVAPHIEPEIVLGLKTPPPASAGEERLRDCVAWVAHGFEIVDCHFPSWKFAAADTVADFGLHGTLLVGRRVPAGEIDGLTEDLRAFEIVLSCNGEERDRGVGANALGSPLLALGYLAEVLVDRPQFAYLLRVRWSPPAP